MSNIIPFKPSKKCETGLFPSSSEPPRLGKIRWVKKNTESLIDGLPLEEDGLSYETWEFRISDATAFAPIAESLLERPTIVEYVYDEADVMNWEIEKLLNKVNGLSNEEWMMLPPLHRATICAAAESLDEPKYPNYREIEWPPTKVKPVVDPVLDEDEDAKFLEALNRENEETVALLNPKPGISPAVLLAIFVCLAALVAYVVW